MIGQPLDALSLRDRAALTGKWIALELYTPETLPLRIIEAIGASSGDCAAQLRARHLDPVRYEFTLLPPPY
ncbi:MAG: hypothetical protein M3Z09_15070 [Acidobacteriota bacterium]|nr:hypothetical protein [Acidobacteriota bacterium]